MTRIPHAVPTALLTYEVFRTLGLSTKTYPSRLRLGVEMTLSSHENNIRLKANTSSEPTAHDALCPPRKKRLHCRIELNLQRYYIVQIHILD